MHHNCSAPSALTIGALVLLSATAAAQPPGRAVPAPRTLSLEDSMALAATTTEGVRAARAAAAQAAAEVRVAQASWWPQISGSVSYEATIASEWDDVFDPALTSEAPGLTELPFVNDHAWRVGVTLDQTLWSFGRIESDVAFARAQSRRASIAVSSAGASAQLTAAQAYYGALLAEQLLEIARATLDQAQQSLQLTQFAFEQGTRAEFDVLRAQVSRDNQRSIVIQRRSERDQARVRLRRAAGVDLTRPLVLTTPLESPELAAAERVLAGLPAEPISAPGLDAQLAASLRLVNARAPVRQAVADLEVQEAQERRARANRYPNLALTSNLGVVNYPDDPIPGTNFDEWRDYWIVGVSLTVPIFTGFRISRRIDAAEAGVRQARARLGETRRAAVVDAFDTRQAVELARATWAQNVRTVVQARRAYEIAELQFEQGVSSQLDLVDARLQLDQARVNRARAAHDLQLAQLRQALLPDLPLGGGAEVGIEAPMITPIERIEAPTPTPALIPGTGFR